MKSNQVFRKNKLSVFIHILLKKSLILVGFVLLDVQFYVYYFVDRCLSFCLSSSGHCIGCPSSIYASDYLLNILQLFLLTKLGNLRKIRQILLQFNKELIFNLSKHETSEIYGRIIQDRGAYQIYSEKPFFFFLLFFLIVDDIRQLYTSLAFQCQYYYKISV